MKRAALAIHGGCGVMAKLDLTDEEWAAARGDLACSLQAGWAILSAGGSAVDAVGAAVMVMEDSAHFNAGHGAALNAAGYHELDASIMDGRSLTGGAVAGVREIRNPVRAARLVMERGDAVLMAGRAADEYARAGGLDMVPNSYFTTQRRVKALAAMKEHERRGTAVKASEAEKHGTVGAAALDMAGHLAAATSTGGYTNKLEGRVGDSPVLGAGTYARDRVCAVSGTGMGELFILHAVGHEVASRIAYLGESLEDAASRVIFDELKPRGASGGLVAVGADGAITMPYNTDGMFRGWVTPEGKFHVATHHEVFELPASADWLRQKT